MDISLSDLIPVYPSQDDPNYQYLISSKKEFNELKTSPRENLTSEGKFKHQTLIERFMLTMDRGFLFHRTGTGKTCSIIGSSEYYRSISEGLVSTFRSLHNIETPVKPGHVYIILKGPTLISEFENQFFCVCTNRKYVTPDLENTKAGTQRTLYINRELKKWYSIVTYDTFLGKIEKMSDEDIIRKFSDSIFFADEIHSGLTKSRYEPMYRLFHLIRRSKVFLASATPMMNQVYPDIVQIMNLILPLYRQIPKKNKYSDEELLNYFSGMISYVREFDTGVDVKYIGKPIETSEEFEKTEFKPSTNIQQLQLTKFQGDAYIKLYNKYNEEANEESPFGKDFLSILSFVFPDGSYGGKFPRNIDRNDRKKDFIVYGISKYVISPKPGIYQPTEEFKRYLSNIENIRRSSVKNAYIIDYLIKNPRKKAFIYEDRVHGSGLIVKSLCFEYVRTSELPNGFSRYDGDVSAFITTTSSGQRSICHDRDDKNRKIRLQPKKRFAMITSGEIANKSNIDNILKLFNSYENRYGDYIQVLFGSEKIRDGINLSDVTEVFIYPSWNEAGTYQAISRTIRATSHINLIEDIAKEKNISPEKVRIDINIHKLAGVMPTVVTWDQQMFLTSEYKDRQIKQAERLLMRSANDCHIHYDRNIRSTDIAHSPECAYGDCKYECISVKPDTVDFSTFDILFIDSLISRLSKTIVPLFQINPVMRISDLYGYYQDVEPKYINQAVEQMVYDKKPLLNSYGYTVFLETQGNIVFIQYDYPSINIHYPISEYPKLVSINQAISLEDFIRDYIEKTALDITGDEFNLEPDELEKKLDELDPILISRLVEKVIIDWKINGNDTTLNRTVISHFSPYIYSVYEPVKDIIRSKENLKDKEIGKGRKALVERMKPYKYADSMYPEDSDNQIIYFHNLLEIKQEKAGYGKSNSITKPSDKIRLLRTSEKVGWRPANHIELPVYNAIKKNKYSNLIKERFGKTDIYGTYMVDRVFRIIDKKEEKEFKDKRAEPTGRECATSSFYIEDMYKILAKLKILPPDSIVQKIPKIASDKMEEFVRKKLKDNKTTFNKKDIEIIYLWLKSGYKRDRLCPLLQEYMDKNNLLLKPQNISFLQV